ncbi:short-chain dehydrogenase/reductase-like protein SDR [Ascobolus immersus RN42]|uniref:Short-chain dehydrogenase/reductase-like protein SDR n=1 Tax=Ascobolus immersus RN42 TaxID=1160509 RepID=A0A3N4HW77_ASCIM|nr:short-chain dehydrogenase/reductase-like protein SDR [Ascobolus immersus RN42]
MDTTSLFSVKGKTVLITGGAKGIGLMISTGFVSAGAHVYISSRDEAACAAAAAQLNELGKKTGGKCSYIAADFYKVEDIEKLVAEIKKREPKLHVLINNSGSTWGAPYESYPDSAWTRVLTLNLQRVFTLTQQLTPLLEAAATEEDPARIINIGSVDGIRTPAMESFAYSASKAGLHQLSKVLAYWLGMRRITVNVLACGPFESKMMKATLEKYKDTIVNSIPLGRIGKPEDVAGACIFLSSQAGAYVNGATIALDGGSLVAAKL